MDGDQGLVAAAQAGDDGAFVALVRQHTPAVHRTAARLLSDRGAVEDVVQEVWLSVWVHLSGFSGHSAFTTWLYRVTVNTAANSRRREASRPAVPVAPQDLPSPAAASAETRTEEAELVTAVRIAIRRLPERQRAVVVLRDLEGLSYEQTAQVLQMNVPGVKSALHRGRTALAASLTGWR